MDGATDDDCPVCKGPFENPSEPVPCCRKVFCQSCLKQAILVRPMCPYCRSPMNNRTTHTVRTVMQPTARLHRRGATFLTTRTVSPNVQALLNQLIVSAQASQTASTPNVSLPNQVASNAVAQTTGHSAITPLIRAVPRPRIQTRLQVAPAAPDTPVPHPTGIQANINPQSALQSDDPDDTDWQVEIAATETASHSGNILRTFNCPYCQEGGLDDLDLRDHCNNNHLHDQRRVVSLSLCVSLPYGNPTYCSRDFIGHLNLRHSYYIEDITNIHQNDDINLQDALWRSWQQT